MAEMQGEQMFSIAKPNRQWSEIGIRALVGSIIAAVVLALLEGYLRGPFLGSHTGQHDEVVMLYTWVNDFRYITETIISSSTIFIVGTKFIETRTIFSVGFDKLDAAKMVCNGPDDENVVWIGRRYGTRIEAESVAAALSERLKESAD